MKCSYIVKGFIDPRRADTITVNFELQEKEFGVIISSNHPFCGSQLYIGLMKKYPWLERFKRGRETSITVDGKKLYRMSGNGPMLPYPIPMIEEGDSVGVIMNFVECKNTKCASCRDGFCNDTLVVKKGSDTCENFK